MGRAKKQRPKSKTVQDLSNSIHLAGSSTISADERRETGGGGHTDILAYSHSRLKYLNVIHNPREAVTTEDF